MITIAPISLDADISDVTTSNDGALVQCDVYTNGARAVDARDPYIDGTKVGKFEIYLNDARAGDTCYLATGGSSN